MLKVLPNFSFGQQPNIRCGEVFCQGAESFTIICTFCEMKTFEFQDFLLHFKNVHFENSFMKTEEVKVACTPLIGINIKNEDNEFEEVDSKEDYSISTTAVKNTINNFEQNDWGLNESSSDEVDDWNEKGDNDDDVDWIPHPDDDEEQESKPKKPCSKNQLKLLQCDKCKKLYKTEAMLGLHVQKYHSEDKMNGATHKCNLCSEEFPLLRLLSSHMIKKHRGFQCSQCDRKYVSKYELKKHEVQHTGIRNFVCDFENCGKRFFLKTQLTVHRRIHTEPNKFICETCGYTCRVKETLLVHYRSHTGEKPFPCNLCDKRFSSSSALKEHQPIHSTERPHVCDVCGAAFSRPKALYHHKHLHLGIKKFKCKLCGNAYAQAAGLAGHMRQHKADKF